MTGIAIIKPTKVNTPTVDILVFDIADIDNRMINKIIEIPTGIKFIMLILK